MNKTLLIACVALVAVYVSAAPVQTEETIGEWRDYVNDSWDHNLRIVGEGDQYTMVITPTRGRVFRRELIAAWRRELGSARIGRPRGLQDHPTRRSSFVRQRRRHSDG